MRAHHLNLHADLRAAIAFVKRSPTFRYNAETCLINPHDAKNELHFQATSSIHLLPCITGVQIGGNF
jgi:hypothetical protein